MNVDYKVFLTIFEDVSGFGVWIYPDDEQLKPPLGSIDLKLCQQHRISEAPRDICARLSNSVADTRTKFRDS